MSNIILQYRILEPSKPVKCFDPMTGLDGIEATDEGWLITVVRSDYMPKAPKHVIELGGDLYLVATRAIEIKPDAIAARRRQWEEEHQVQHA